MNNISAYQMDGVRFYVVIPTKAISYRIKLLRIGLEEPKNYCEKDIASNKSNCLWCITIWSVHVDVFLQVITVSSRSYNGKWRNFYGC